jgi:putative aldouronate transport system permease protein
VNATGLRNKLWALVLPGAVQAFNITILLNFFRQIPKELEEAAIIDGAGQLNILARVYIPLSIPALATLLLFNAVGHWNEWFSAMIYMNSSKNYPLQTYLQGVLTVPNYSFVDPTQMELLSRVSSKTFRAAQILIATVPVLFVYPFLQKYFITGMTLGSLKG